jgi:hypothetical protein
LFGQPWPPLSPALVAEPVPLVVGPDGIAPGGDGARFVPWAEVRDIAADGPRLRLNGETAATLATRRGARALARVLAEVGGLPRDQREGRLGRWLDERFDVATTRARLTVLRRETRALRIAANVLWAGLFVGLPVLLWTRLAFVLWPPIAAVTIAAWITAAVLFGRALRRSSWLDRELRPELAKRIAAVASPLATVRAADHIARELCGDLDPLAVAAAVLPADGVRRLGRSMLCDLHFRGPDAVPAGAEMDTRWMRAALLSRVERVLRGRDVDPQRLLAPPGREVDMASWCPSCLAQYRRVDAREPTCTNVPCRGMSLRAFE